MTILLDRNERTGQSSLSSSVTFSLLSSNSEADFKQFSKVFSLIFFFKNSQVWRVSSSSLLEISFIKSAFISKTEITSSSPSGCRAILLESWSVNLGLLF